MVYRPNGILSLLDGLQITGKYNEKRETANSRRRRVYFCSVILIFPVILLYHHYGNLFNFSPGRKWLDINGSYKDEDTHGEKNKTVIVVQTLQKVENSSQFISTLTNDLTVVTAYFSIGKFGKGSATTYRTPEEYDKWFGVFGYINNPVVAFFDREETAKVFKEIRANFPSNLSCIVILKRNETRIFQLLPNISEIFNQSDYAQHHPNTIVPGYAAAVNAKYEVVQMAIDSNPFKTKYFCWLDTGYFRELVNDTDIFKLDRPLDFKETSVAYGSVRKRDPNLTARQIVYENINMIAGGIFLGRWDILRQWTVEYLDVFENLVKRKLVSADQQTLYIIINENTAKTNLQIYNIGRIDDWFHLGFKCKEAGMLRAGSSVKYKTTHKITTSAV